MKNKIFLWLTLFCCDKVENKEEEKPSRRRSSRREKEVNSANSLKDITEFESHNSTNLFISSQKDDEISIEPIDEKKNTVNNLSLLEDAETFSLRRTPTFGNPTFSDLCMKYITKEESTGGTTNHANDKKVKKRKGSVRKSSKKSKKSEKLNN
ncbi:unnamed protein product [Blepharisma stoltei]|uniref:Uncharacterized protein n=1 Tax=Blepharisma stoltei TaxID=1481888 RepID=A0AAU9JJT5_9CILI|nr:unnamed protein product [Blepharisma stoltei]